MSEEKDVDENATCQVLQNVAHWPYAKRCTEEATHSIVAEFRFHGGGVELVCDKHARNFRQAYGRDSTRLLPGFEYFEPTGE